MPRSLDRIHITGNGALQSSQPAGEHSVPTEAAAMVAGFLPADGATWAELGLIVRYFRRESIGTSLANLRKPEC